jgi:hypothetical protein
MEGRLDFIKWLYENGHLFYPVLVDYLYFKDDEEIPALLNYLMIYEGNTTRLMDGACMFGYLEVVNFLHENQIGECSACLFYTSDAADETVYV